MPEHLPGGLLSLRTRLGVLAAVMAALGLVVAVAAVVAVAGAVAQAPLSLPTLGTVVAALVSLPFVVSCWLVAAAAVDRWWSV
jgi:ABC-type methionine transport system permease subunit